MERRLAAKWLIKQSMTGFQDVGEPPTRHRLSVLQTAEAA
jgi:hypothetical protein